MPCPVLFDPLMCSGSTFQGRFLPRCSVPRDEKVAAVLIIRVGYKGEGGSAFNRTDLHEKREPDNN